MPRPSAKPPPYREFPAGARLDFLRGIVWAALLGGSLEPRAFGFFLQAAVEEGRGRAAGGVDGPPPAGH